MKNKQRVVDDWIHVADLLPTLTSAAGIDLKNLKLDGIDQWPTISEGKPSKRREILNILDNVAGYSGYIYDGWKLVNGTDTKYNSWYGNYSHSNHLNYHHYARTVFNSIAGKSIKNLNNGKDPPLTSRKIQLMRLHATVFCDEFMDLKRSSCDPNESACLFDLYKDPCELNNIAETHGGKLLKIQEKFNRLVARARPSRRRPIDPRASAEYFNNTLNWWQPDGEKY